MKRDTRHVVVLILVPEGNRMIALCEACNVMHVGAMENGKERTPGNAWHLLTHAKREFSKGGIAHRFSKRESDARVKLSGAAR